MLNTAAIDKLKAGLRGELIQRNDPRYEEARKLYNAMIDKRPLLIVRCVDVADVISAVRFGRENALLTAIRGGGHNGPGLGSCDDGLVIDLSLMQGVRVDASNRTVRAEAGCTHKAVWITLRTHSAWQYPPVLFQRPALPASRLAEVTVISPASMA
jgi:FAD/FMN-containing dehydrogenase